MTEQKIIGKGTWIDKLAFELIEREKQLGRNIDGIIKVESGLGASGIPHIGSLGDAVRAYGVKLALENFGYKSELIAYSDDLDGLRKIPEGLEVNPDDIGRRVSYIKDPYGDCHDSYGSHMSSLLLDGLRDLGIEFTHKTAHETYKNNLLKDQIHEILVNSKKIGDKIKELTGQEKFQTILPYFPVCDGEHCGRLYTTESFEYIEEEKKIRYRCKDSEIGSKVIEGCGYEGESDITKDLGKLAWKVEFAARWKAFDIRFEAYGKDIMDSVKVNDWVSDEILGFPHPHHVKYEMFLDKDGKKISKSLGNVVTSQKWLHYGTSKSILLLLYKRITGARELGFEDIPALMAEYNELENIYFGKTKVDNEAKLVKSKGLYEYVNLLNPPKSPGMHVNYRLLIELCKIFKDNRSERVTSKLIDYGTIKEENDDVKKLISLSGHYSDDFLETKIPAAKLEIDDSTKNALKQLVKVLEEDNKIEDLQNSIYSIAKENQVQPKDFFRILYRIIIAGPRGPKLGGFIEDIGKKEVAEKIKRNV
jgi:lysyl-tRNA synthetase class 1